MTEATKSGITERPPIVVVLGHVDHGKSTLLDYIRKSDTVSGEAGGITQRVAAYEVSHKDELGAQKKITFLDTPGHEAFQAMRTRSTHAADIAILVVSAEDGVREQTKEAINTILEQKVPFVIAINKIDKSSANIEKTISSLAEHEVYLEGRGGNTPYATISAKTGEGIDTLLELVLLVAELEELTGDSNTLAEGFVIESHRDPKKGVSATLLITNGVLSRGMYLATENSTAPTRIIEDFTGHSVEKATFSSPVHIVGWSTPPTVGSKFASFAKKKEAESYVTKPTNIQGESSQSITNTEKDAVSPKADEPRSDASEREETNTVYIPIIIKTDAIGSIDAIKHEIEKLKDDITDIKILRGDVGAVSENDIKTAGGDNRTLVIGFNTKIESGAQELADRDGITIKTFDIIYKLAEWLEKEIDKRKPNIVEEQVHGTVTILRVFSTTKKSQVVGGRVESGKISVGDQVSILRREEEIGTGKIKELQSQKQSAESVTEENECGLKIETTVTITQKDTLKSVS